MNKKLGLATLWAIPAVVFLSSGLSKLLGEPGQQPDVLAAVVSRTTYAALLQVLGAVEIATAAALAWRHSRTLAVALGLALLAAFSALVAISPTDQSFLENCGCGALISSWQIMHDPTAVLIRNGALGLLLAAAARPRTWLRSALAVAAAVLAGLLVAEKGRSSDDRAVLHALLTENRAQRTGWAFPDLRLRRPDGSEARAAQELRPGDGIMVFSADCVHCRAAAGGWPALRDKLEARGGRFVALEASPTASDTAAFLAAHGMADVPSYALVRQRDVLELGVVGVPHFIQLGESNVVTRQTNGFTHTPAHLALGAILGAETVLAGLGDALFGEGEFELTGPPRVAGGTTLGTGCAAGEELLVAVGQNRPSDAFQAECGLAIGRDGRIVRAAAIVWKVGLTGMEEPEPYLERLTGLTLREAADYCKKLVTVDDHGHVWMALAGAVGHVAANVPGTW